MAAMMVLNPKRARRRKPGARKMTAKQLRFFGPRKKRSAPEVIVVSKNPKRRKAATVARKRKTPKQPYTVGRGKIRRLKLNPAKRRRFRRNPLPASLGGFVNGSVIPAGIGAAGALGVDYVLANFVPPTMKTPAMLPLWRIGGAFGVGALVSMLAGRKAGEEATTGALVVAAYVMGRAFVQNNVPGVTLQRYVPMNRYLGNAKGMGFVRRNMQGMGATQQAQANGARRLRRLQQLGQQLQTAIANTRGQLNGLGPVPNNFPGARSQLGATSPNSVTKFRILRDGSTYDDNTQGHGNGQAANRGADTSNGLGYIGPARTMGRYLGR